jgi:hypothetical protein
MSNNKNTITYKDIFYYFSWTIIFYCSLILLPQPLITAWDEASKRIPCVRADLLYPFARRRAAPPCPSPLLPSSLLAALIPVVFRLGRPSAPGSRTASASERIPDNKIMGELLQF